MTCSQTTRKKISKYLVSLPVFLLVLFKAHILNCLLIGKFILMGVYIVILYYLYWIIITKPEIKNLYENTFIKLDDKQIHINIKILGFYKDLYIQYNDIKDIHYKDNTITFVINNVLSYKFSHINNDSYLAISEFVNSNKELKSTL